MMPRIVEFEQGSPEWKDWRNAGIGGSDLPVIMGVSPYSTPAKLWEVKKSGIDTFSGNWATERGQRLEPEARALCEQSLSVAMCQPVILRPVCMESSHNPWQRASLDGFAEVDDATFGLKARVGVEIKCLGEKAHMEAVQHGTIPGHYMPQLAWQQHVGILDRVFMAFYNPDMQEAFRFVLLEWTQPDGYLMGVLEAADEFHDNLKRSVNPYTGLSGIPEGWERAAEEYATLKAIADDASAAADEAKKRLLDLAGGNEVSGHGVRVQRVQMPGSIDWKRFQSENPDVADKVEACRKPGSITTKVLLTKEETK